MTPDRPPTGRALVPALMFIALVVAVVGSLGAPLITAVATQFHTSLADAQWTLTAPLLAGAVATPLLGRLGSTSHRRQALLGTLIMVLAGGVLTVVAPSFGWLLAGRALQGVGIALTALSMGIARDHVKSDRSASVLALLSVASTVGIGIGYPTAGVLTELGGLRLAYIGGLVVSLLALIVAWRVAPDAPAGRSGAVDVVGAALLGVSLVAILLVIGENAMWTEHPRVAAGVAITGLALLAAWALAERRVAAPLVDLSVLRRPAAVAANASMLLAGIAMYLLLALVTRWMQTPRDAGYGFGASVLGASLVLIPFSALGFAGGRAAPRLREHVGVTGMLVAGALPVLAGSAFFAVARTTLWEPYVVMALLGLGVGIFSAAMPAAILTVVPAAETSAAMSFNQVVRGVGFSAGSALAGLVLAAFTASAFPAAHGYTIGGWIAAALMAVTIVVVVLTRPRQPEVERTRHCELQPPAGSARAA